MPVSEKLVEVLDKSFQAFQTCGDPELTKMLEAARRFAHDLVIDAPPRWLSLLGTSGAGKTMLAKIISALFRRYVDSDRIISETPSRIVRASGGFVKWSRVVQWLREGEYRCFEDISRDYFVVVDDIGSENPTDFTRAKLYEMFDAGEGKWRVWTANLSLAQIGEKFDTRIASRMIRNNAVVIDVDVPDYNLREKP